MLARAPPPPAALRRELVEELGYALRGIRRIATFFVSPGGSSERIFLYYAAVRARVAAGGGRAAEHEDIRRVALTRAQARAMLARGAFLDAKTIVALQWFFSRPGSPNARPRARARAT
jgi:ADP-ribose pyrophosphatase